MTSDFSHGVTRYAPPVCRCNALHACHDFRAGPDAACWYARRSPALPAPPRSLDADRFAHPAPRPDGGPAGEIRLAAQASGRAPGWNERTAPSVAILRVPLHTGLEPMRRICLVTVLVALGSPLAAQRAENDSSLLSVDRIFASPEFR